MMVSGDHTLKSSLNFKYGFSGIWPKTKHQQDVAGDDGARATAILQSFFSLVPLKLTCSRYQHDWIYMVPEQTWDAISKNVDETNEQYLGLDRNLRPRGPDSFFFLNQAYKCCTQI